MYREGQWVKWRHHEGWVANGKVLEVRPDDALVIGQHDNDPEPAVVQQDKVIRKI